MKYFRKIVVMFVVIVMICFTAMTASAATSMQDGIKVELVTDKEAYRSNEPIIARLEVTNTNDVEITNVSLENIIPKGYRIATGSTLEKQVDVLKAGETVMMTITYVPDTKMNAGNGNIENCNMPSGMVGINVLSPKTNDRSNSLSWKTLIVVFCIGIIALLAKGKRKKFVFPLLLGVAMIEITAIGGASIRAQAAESASRSIDISTKVNVDNNDVIVGAKISYNGKVPDDTPKTYTRGEWIDMLANKVGMGLSVDPDKINYYYADSKANPYGIAIEAAQAYGILPPPDIEDLKQDIPYFYPDEIATREFAAYTAVRAMGFDGTHSFDTSVWNDWNLIRYQNEAAVAVGNNFLKLDANKNFNPAVPVSDEDIESIFAVIDDIKRADETIDESVYDASIYVEGILKNELSGITNYTVSENGNGRYTVVLPKTQATNEIKEGKVIVLPANSVYLGGISLKVASITDQGTQLILECTEPELSEVFTKIDFAGGGTAIVGEIVPAEGIDVQYSTEGFLDDTPRTYLAGNLNVGGSTEVPGTFKFDLGEGKKINDNLELSGNIEIEIPRITCIADVDVGVSDTRVNEFTVALTEKIKVKGGLKYTLSESGYELSDGSFEKGRIELGRFPIAIGTTGLSFDFVFFYNFEAKGSANIEYKFETTQGYQYKNGAGRVIFDYDDKFDLLELKGDGKVGLGAAGDLCAFTIFDLAGWSGEGGVAYNASVTPHILATDTLYCVDGTLYAYAKHGLDQETLLGVFLKDVCHYTLEFETLKNDHKNPYKLKFHIENGKRVSECTFGMGGITGYVYALDGNSPLKDARVNIYSYYADENDLVRTLYTETDGQYSIDNLIEGTYRVVVSATGYFTYEVAVKVERNQMTYIENMLMVDRNGSGASSLVEGKIRDAVTGEGVTNTTYVLREGWNNTDGEEVAAGTFENDSYSMSLGVGNYTLEISKDEYVTNYSNIAVSENLCTGTNISLVPASGSVTGENLRIVLTWGEYPEDLDSHLVCLAEDAYHIYFSDMKHNDNEGTEIAGLDIDDTTSYGPETTTVYKMRPGDKFSFYVHDYTNSESTNSSEISNSGAKVQVYLGNDNIASYTIPSNREGTLWHVFDYDASSNTIVPVNQFSYQENSGAIGGGSINNLRNADVKKDVEKTNSDANGTSPILGGNSEIEASVNTEDGADVDGEETSGNGIITDEKDNSDKNIITPDKPVNPEEDAGTLPEEIDIIMFKEDVITEPLQLPDVA